MILRNLYRYPVPPRISSDPETLEKNKNIKVLQINLNKSNSAMQEFTISLRKETNFICLVTEPSIIKHRLSGIPGTTDFIATVTEPSEIRHRLSGIPRHYNSIPTLKDNSPRAAIFTSPSIPIQEISNLSHRDFAVGLIKCGSKQTAIISAYMDIKVKPVTEHLQAAIDYCKSRGYSILLTADTNSHSKI